MSSSPPPRRPVRRSRRLICDLMPCTRCMRTVRIYFRDSTHVVCSQCNHCMSVDEMISRNPELYERWARVRPDERIVLERSSAVSRIAPPPFPSPRPTQLAHGQEMVDSVAGSSSTQATPSPPPPHPQEEAWTSWSIMTTTTSQVVGGAGLPSTSTPQIVPVEVRFLFELLSRLAIKGASIEALPTVTVTPEHTENERSRSCSGVCHDNLKVGEMVKEMPCKHLFHNDCFVHWFRLQNSCPVCGCLMPVRLMTVVAAHTGGANRVLVEAGRRHGGGSDGEAAGTQGGGSEGEAAGRPGGGSDDDDAVGRQGGGSDEEAAERPGGDSDAAAAGKGEGSDDEAAWSRGGRFLNED